MPILDSRFFLVVVFLITVCHNGNVGAADIPFITAIILGILSFLLLSSLSPHMKWTYVRVRGRK